MPDLNKNKETHTTPLTGAPFGIEGANRWACLEDRIPGAMKLLADQRERERTGKVEARRPQSLENLGGGVLILPVKGSIFPKAAMTFNAFGLDLFRAQLRAAAANPEITAIVLDIDSPGGMVDGVRETGELIRSIRAAKPIIAFTDSLAASAAYWIAAQAGEIVVGRDAMIGSIGAFMIHGDFSGMFEQSGIDITIIRSPARKAEANSFEPLTEEATGRLQQIVDITTGRFQAEVAKGRGISAGTVRTDFGQGIVLMSNEAHSVGMVDRIDALEGVLSRLTKGGRARKTRADGEDMIIVMEEPESHPGCQIEWIDPQLVASHAPAKDHPDTASTAQQEAERARALDLDVGA